MSISTLVSGVQRAGNGLVSIAILVNILIITLLIIVFGSLFGNGTKPVYEVNPLYRAVSLALLGIHTEETVFC